MPRMQWKSQQLAAGIDSQREHQDSKGLLSTYHRYLAIGTSGLQRAFSGRMSGRAEAIRCALLTARRQLRVYPTMHVISELVYLQTRPPPPKQALLLFLTVSLNPDAALSIDACSCPTRTLLNEKALRPPQRLPQRRSPANDGHRSPALRRNEQALSWSCG